METIKEITPHPLFSNFLFAYKKKASSVFRDVLGLYEIHHIAISQVNEAHQLLTLSSTPALEYNLFNKELWRFDKTYQRHWINLCTHADWQSLYDSDRYDELYYIKQSKHHYSLGISLAAKLNDVYLIFSFASRSYSHSTQHLFMKKKEHFSHIGMYCLNSLFPLFSTFSMDIK